MTEKALKCSVYRSSKKEGMYLYVPREDSFESVPEELLGRFGTPGHVMDLALTADRKLARVDVRDVLNGLQQKGFYLQLPPSETLK